MIRRVLSALRAWFALIVIGVTFLWATVTIVMHRTIEAPPGTLTLHVGHWQLESGVRDAFNALAADYQRLHPNVRIIQDAVPEGAYGQWLTTQLMGGTAPDILQIGTGCGLPAHVMLAYYNRYFTPLTRAVNQPNPYNAGTDIERVPLRATYKDGMRSSYIDELQEYMSMPLALFGVRVFYNRDLLKKITGLEAAPRDYRAFLGVCEQIKRAKNPQGKNYIPIAGSRYHIGWWEGLMMDPLTYGVVRRADFNRDGFVGNDEMYVAFKTGRIDFNYPPLRARFTMLREVTDNFQTGFTGLTRDEAVFLFAQQNAVFITSGTWDARSLVQQAEGQFRVGIMDFPLPAKDDPFYGPVIEGPCYERPLGGFPFCITRTSRHPEIALDFLLFLSSRRGNEKFNRIAGWIPCVTGAEMEPFLKDFEPHLEGVYGAMNLFLGGETWVKWLQLSSLYQVRQISYETLTAEFTPFYKEHGLRDFMELQSDWRRGMHNNEQFLAGMRALAMHATNDAPAQWIKYRTLAASRQIRPEIEHGRQMDMLARGPALAATGPYEYSSNVLAMVRRRLEQGGGK